MLLDLCCGIAKDLAINIYEDRRDLCNFFKVQLAFQFIWFFKNTNLGFKNYKQILYFIGINLLADETKPLTA